MDNREPTLNLAAQYPPGTIVDAQVTIVKSFEAVLELANGITGIVRNRELRWGPAPDYAGQVLQKGQRIKAMVMGVDNLKQRLKLSLRQAERDPWGSVRRRYKIGQVVRCKVTSLLPRVAFVELEPGVEGYIPFSEICVRPAKRIDEMIWVGDTVDAVITSLKYHKRRVVLSIRKHLFQLAESTRIQRQRRHLKDCDQKGAALFDFLKTEDRLALLNLSRAHDHGDVNHSSNPAYARLASHFNRVLIADDDPSFRFSLSSLLEKLGHVVMVVERAEDAVTACSEKNLDLVLIDLRFRGGGMNGWAAVHTIASNNDKLPILIVTGAANIDVHNVVTRARHAGARGILFKPVAIGSLIQHMNSILSGDNCWKLEESATESDLITHFGSAIDSFTAHVDLQKALTTELLKLQHATQATACILFKMALDTGVVRVLAHTGTPLAAYHSNKYTLQASPIHEVIRKQIELHEEDTGRNPERFKYLNLIDYASCIGVPVPTLGQKRHSIFLFHPEKGHFTREDLREATMAARFIGSIFDREEIKNVVRKVQPLAFAGQIGSTLVHELNNRLGSVLNYAETLLMEHDALENDLTAAMDFRFRRRVRSCVENIHDNARGMEKIASLYFGLMRVEDREVVRVNEIVQRAASILTPFAESSHVEIFPELEDDLPATMAIGSWLEQAFINIALNAIQHLNLSSGGGELTIQTRFAKHETPSLQVFFIDNGPGIHGQNLEHIFDLGFSTRTGGTGLGLFTSRGLVEALGGRITVPASVMLVGTTFMVELPLVVPSVEESPHE